MYANEVKTKEKEKLPAKKMKLNYNIYLAPAENHHQPYGFGQLLC